MKRRSSRPSCLANSALGWRVVQVEPLLPHRNAATWRCQCDHIHRTDQGAAFWHLKELLKELRDLRQCHAELRCQALGWHRKYQAKLPWHRPLDMRRSLPARFAGKWPSRTSQGISPSRSAIKRAWSKFCKLG